MTTGTLQRTLQIIITVPRPRPMPHHHQPSNKRISPIRLLKRSPPRLNKILIRLISEQVSLTKLLYEFLTTTGQVSPLSLFMTIAMHTHYDDESHRLFCLLNIFLLLQKKRGGTSHDEEDEEDHDRSRLLLAVFLLVKMIRPQFPNLARPFFSKGFTSSKASPRTGSLTRRTFWRTSKICTGCPRRSRL